MKILVFAYDLVVAGVTVNAIELSAALRDLHGHDVVLHAAPGPMLERVEQKRLRYVPAPPAHLSVHPSPARMRALRETVKRERPDIIHVWDWVPCIDAYYVEHLVMGVPMVVTDMSMDLQYLLPKRLPTTFGIPELADQARKAGWRHVEVLLPPVDVHENSPDAVDARAFRERYAPGTDATTLVIVSRVDSYMKSEGLFRCVDAVRTLGRDLPLRLVIVGDGDARAALEARAEQVNAELKRTAVVLTGALVDPRPAYLAADVVIGMGGSALRGMASGKPVVIVGVKGFAAPFNPETAASFLYRGIYGVGRGAADAGALRDSIRQVAERPDRFAALGDFARAFVVEHFALETVSTKLARFCEGAIESQPTRHGDVIDGLTTAAVWVRERRFVPFGWSARRLLPWGGQKPAA